MLHIDIRIHAQGDPFPIFDFGDRFKGEATLKSVGILEAGMQSGAVSVALNFELPDGSVYLAQVSGTMMLAIAAAVDGAKKRFGDPT